MALLAQCVENYFEPESGGMLQRLVISETNATENVSCLM